LYGLSNNLGSPLLCETFRTGLATTGFMSMPVGLPVVFVIEQDGGGKVSLTGSFAGRLGRRGTVSRAAIDWGGSTTGRKKGSHRCIRQLLEREETTC
jgi:hypothetical protein